MPAKKPGNKLSGSEKAQVRKSNAAVKRRRDVAAGAAQGGLKADTAGLRYAERDLDKVNARTGMSAAEQARKDAEGTAYERPKTREEVVTGHSSGQQFKGHGGKVFSSASDRNDHNRKFVRDMMKAGAPIPESMHRDLERAQRDFETTKSSAAKESARTKVGRILQAGAIDTSKFPKGTACQTPNCNNNAKEVVCDNCMSKPGGDVAGASYRDKPAPKPETLTKTKAPR